MGEEGPTEAPPSLSVYKQLIVAEEGRNIFFSSVVHQQGLYAPKEAHWATKKSHESRRQTGGEE